MSVYVCVCMRGSECVSASRLVCLNSVSCVETMCMCNPVREHPQALHQDLIDMDVINYHGMETGTSETWETGAGIIS